jgi:mannose-1-phosphate guanylyltransferase
MAGGGGTRFWPMSREEKPKQFLDILGTGKTLLQQTYERFNQFIPEENILIVTNKKYRKLTKKQLPDINDQQILAEPMRKNTAPCIAYAAHKIADADPQANMIVAPSDHLITNEKAFEESMKLGLKTAQEKKALLTLGIRPTHPDTGYGYIQYVDPDRSSDQKSFKVKTFTEKPTKEIAQKFIKSGDFLWNSGIFIWNVATILTSFKEHLPDIHDVFEDGKDIYNTAEEQSFIDEAYTMCTNISIDYGIMEKADNVYVIPAEFGWSDLGTWSSLYEQLEKDYLGNAVLGKNVMVYDTSNCMVNVPEEKLVILKGLEDYVVVEANDILLVSPKSEEQNIKQILADVKRYKGDQFL